MELEDRDQGGLPHHDVVVAAELKKEVQEVQLLRRPEPDQVFDEVHHRDGAALHLEENDAGSVKKNAIKQLSHE